MVSQRTVELTADVHKKKLNEKELVKCHESTGIRNVYCQIKGTGLKHLQSAITGLTTGMMQTGTNSEGKKYIYLQ